LSIFIVVHSLTEITGYKARTHIAKSLQRRCKAIQNAVKTYNAAALDLDPPRPTVDWTAVSHYNFIEEFSLLRDTRQDIYSRRWAQPVIRDLMKRAQRITRAHEEIIRCNVELRRLHTWILDENKSFAATLQQLKNGGEILYYAVLDFCSRRYRINRELLVRIAQTQSLEGFTGTTTPGARKNLDVNSVTDVQSIATVATAAETDAAAVAAATEADTAAAEEDKDSEGGDFDDDDEVAHDFEKVMEYILTI
jgi:ribosomal protein S8